MSVTTTEHEMSSLVPVPPDSRVKKLRLKRDSVSLSGARELTRQTLKAWGVSRGCVSDAVLVVSELVTNVIVHAGTPGLLKLVWLSPGKFQIHISDGSSEVPRSRPESSGLAVRGYGIGIVEDLAASVEVTSHKEGKTIVAELHDTAG